jgi:23S rRNA (cytidine1920-2'-O)/16S rRNA (cytidine1409-2'-O)-methyltransferase
MRKGEPSRGAARDRRERIDSLLVERGLADTREKARRMIIAGLVQVSGQMISKPGMTVERDASIEVQGQLPYVSRGGLKLEAALDEFGIDPSDMVAADIGASTGGFTDCLLQRGALKVYAIDVGYGQLAWSIRQDQRVVVMERVNVRYLDSLPELVDLITIDVSFISLELVAPVAIRWLAPGGLLVALIKPQFEAGREQVGKGGVVRDAAVHRQVLEHITHWGTSQSLHVFGLIPSPIRGPAGNVEFLIGWRAASAGEGACPAEVLDSMIQDALHAVEISLPDA